jgi:hypothetical protein
MATPRADSYTVNSGSGVYGGIFGPPSWLGASNTWAVLPNSRLDQSGVGWSGANPGGNGGYASIIYAWGGGAKTDSGVFYAGSFRSGTYQLLWGGGHGDYAGNEWYAYGPIESNNPSYIRLNDPTIPAPTNVDRDGNGIPVSRHTYDHLVYLPETNEVLSVGVGGKYSSGGSGTAIDLFDLADMTYEPKGNMTGQGGVGTGISGDWNYGASGYNPTTRNAYVCGIGNGSSVQCFDVATRTMSATTLNNPNGAGNSKGCVDPVRNLLLQMSNSGQLLGINLNTLPNAPTILTTTGTAPSGGIWALDWDSINNRLVVWNSANVSQIHFLTPASNSVSTSWAWSTVNPGGVSPSGVAGNGVYGRFQFVPKWGGGVILFLGANSVGNFYRF